MATVMNLGLRNRLGGRLGRFDEVCRFYKRGTCNRNPCAYLHTEPASNARLRVSNQSRRSLKEKPKNVVKNSLVWTLRVVSEDQNSNQSSNCSTKSMRNNHIVEQALAVASGAAQKSLNHGTEDQQMELPHPSTKRSLVSNIGGHGTEDKPREFMDENLTVSPDVGGEFGAEDTQKNSNASTEEVLLKNTRGSLECPSNSLPDGNNASEDKISQKISASIASTEEVLKCSSNSLPDRNNVSEDKTSQKNLRRGDGFSLLAKLSGHSKALYGIALPSGSDKLFSGSSDGTVRIWDCHTGQTVQIINSGETIGSLISQGPWVFVGMPNTVKAWNIDSGAEFILNGPIGKVQAMVAARDMLFAGAQSGHISVWKAGSEIPNIFQLAASLEGHTGGVLCLAVGANMLYSGSMDGTIRVWSLDTLECVHILSEHSDFVMSLICCNQYLLSCSLDETIKVWSCREEGDKPEVIYTQKEEDAVIALCGVTDGQDKPILLCSSLDGCVRQYELPSFTERGRIFSEKEVRRIVAGPNGLFFTGDGNGMLTVWKMAP